MPLLEVEEIVTAFEYNATQSHFGKVVIEI